MTERRPVRQLLYERALEQFGLITPSDAEELGVEAVRLRQMLRRGTLERVSRGVYRFAISPRHRLDQYAEASFWPQGTRGVLSHETALDLHELCDVNPEKIDLTVPAQHRVQREVPPTYRIHRRDLDRRDRTWIEGLPIVTPVRAILDGVELKLRSSLIRQGIDTLRDRGVLAIDDEARIYRALFVAEGATG